MDDARKVGFGTKLMALGCAICPFCIAARAWPDSRYAKALSAAEKLCPFCRAYDRLHSEGEPADTPDEQPAEI